MDPIKRLSLDGQICKNRIVNPLNASVAFI